MILTELKKFIEEYRLAGCSFLLGFSGGVDSTALLHLLLELEVELQVAHIDHGWRKESGREALFLQKKVKDLGIAWHEKRLRMEKMSEEMARKERLHFFQKVIEKEKLQGLFLAHQKDDLIETSLKRVLEGAQLPFIGGMRSFSGYEKIKIYRPLLPVFKKDLRKFLQQRSISYFEDKTNGDDRFLRGKMRKLILPKLAEDFGKQVDENLYRLSIRANEWQDYLERKVERLWKSKKCGPIGTYVEVSSLKGGEKIEIRYFVQKLLKKEGISPACEELERIVGWIRQGRTDRQLKFKEKSIRCEFGFLFVHRKLPAFDQTLSLKRGEYRLGDWVVKCCRTEKKERRSDWRRLFLGKGSWVVSEGDYFLELPSEGARLGGKRLKKWFSENRVPGFLRYSFPVLVRDGKIVEEFLTGRNRDEKIGLRISFCLNS